MERKPSPEEVQIRKEDEAVAFCRGCGHPCDTVLPQPGGYWRCSQCGKRRQMMPRDVPRRVAFLISNLVRRNARVTAMAQAGLLVYGSRAREPLLQALETRPQHADRFLPVLAQIRGADPVKRLANRLRRLSHGILWRKWVFRWIAIAATVYFLMRGWWCLIFFSIGLAGVPTHDQYRSRLVRALGLTGDPLACGAVAQQFRAGGSVSVAAEEALKRLLPKLSDSHAGKFTAREIQALHNVVLLASPETAVAAVKALVYVGDHHTESFYLSTSAALPHDHPVRKAIDDALPALRKRLEWRKESPTLLRAANGVNEDEGRLLRPASDAPTNPQHLLRAGEAPETDEPQ
ncbi:MAG: hypothetical protein HRF45_08105 [Fimbriimonadia bacterium]|jgi:DNA-directed RNA polymerase subunit RPC12/RpoP